MNRRQTYDLLRPRLIRPGSSVKVALDQMLSEEEVHVLSIDWRVKEFASFEAKISKKGYADPFAEIDDLCGVRVIAYYPSDLSHIGDIIRREFGVLASIDKIDELGVNEFGYRSNHYVVLLPEHWRDAPVYRGLLGLRVEIQVRTVLSHAWANLSHQLTYKAKDDPPTPLRRSISQLSAMFEWAYEQFDRLRALGARERQMA